MVKGTDFEVTKDVWERAQRNHGYMAEEDKDKLFDVSILCGYGLYSCKVREQDGKYICSWWRGETCD